MRVALPLLPAKLREEIKVNLQTSNIIAAPLFTYSTAFKALLSSIRGMDILSSLLCFQISLLYLNEMSNWFSTSSLSGCLIRANCKWAPLGTPPRTWPFPLASFEDSSSRHVLFYHPIAGDRTGDDRFCDQSALSLFTSLYYSSLPLCTNQHVSMNTNCKRPLENGKLHE